MGEQWLKTPSALTIWSLGTGILGGVATVIFTKRVQEAGWSRFKTGPVIFGILAASTVNILIASKLRGE
mgnify:CR=1 FL=1